MRRLQGCIHVQGACKRIDVDDAWRHGLAVPSLWRGYGELDSTRRPGRHFRKITELAAAGRTDFRKPQEACMFSACYLGGDMTGCYPRYAAAAVPVRDQRRLQTTSSTKYLVAWA